MILRKEWSIVLPLLALLALIFGVGLSPATPLLLLFTSLLIGAVIAAVHHAEIIALRVGEPYGSIILAVAVTIIEVALILTLIIATGAKASTLARDTVFSAVMITGAGVVGLSILISALKHHTARFNPEGTASALATVITLAVLALVLPSVTTSGGQAEFDSKQLVFAGIASLVLYSMFIFIQTVRHRDYFLPEQAEEDPETHVALPKKRTVAVSLVFLILSLIAVVGLAKLTSPAVEAAVKAVGAPPSAVGVIIALIVLLPETIAALRNAAYGRMQTSFNLAYGSGMASVGLTIPAIALATIWIDVPLVLGLGTTQIVLLFLLAVISALTVLPGRATLQEGVIHLIIFASFIFFAFVP